MPLPESIKTWQKNFREKVVENPALKKYNKAVWIISIGTVIFVAVQSYPYYTYIGAGKKEFEAGKYDASEEQFKLALQEAEVWGEGDPRLANAVNNLAELYRAKANYKLAESMYLRLLTLAEKSTLNRNLAVALSLNNLAALYKDEGKYAEAEAISKQAVKVWETEVKKPNDANYVMLLNNQARIYNLENRHKEAEELCLKALACEKKAMLGPNNLQLAMLYESLGRIYLDQGNLKQARTYLEEGLKLDRALFRKSHPFIAQDLTVLGELEIQEGNFAQAASHLDEAKAMQATFYKDKHPAIATNQIARAKLDFAQGKYQEALVNFKEAISIRQEIIGAHYPELRENYQSLADVYDKLGDKAEAKKCRELSLKV